MLWPRHFAALEKPRLAHHKITGRAASRGQTILYFHSIWDLGMWSYPTDKKLPTFGWVPELGEKGELYFKSPMISS